MLIKDFFGGYFHQDWYIEAKTPDEVLIHFLNLGFEIEEVKELSASIRTYAETLQDENVAKDALLHDLGCYYPPHIAGMTVRGWLIHVADFLEQRVILANEKKKNSDIN